MANSKRNAGAKHGQLIYRALVKIDNGNGKQKVDRETGEIISRVYAEGEKGAYEPGDIVPESVINQLKRVANGKDTHLDVLYEHSVATEEELEAAKVEAREANIVPDEPAATEEE
jgi:hypothetical protein